jgi:hypothetical protein
MMWPFHRHLGVSVASVEKILKHLGDWTEHDTVQPHPIAEATKWDVQFGGRVRQFD